MTKSDHWYKNAIIYSLDVDDFQDGNGDGIGDFIGLTQRLDYLDGLGVTCLWLLPFFPSPNRDNGYDVKDYYNVDPRLGTLGDFVDFMREARERGLRILIDLVVNHTSIDHPWFQEARSNPKSKYRDFYIWNDNPPEDTSDEAIFPGEQHTIWTYDRKAKSHYLHRFYNHQPDLNIENPEVRAEIRKIMGYWLELGVSGFRLDAAPFLIELRGVGNEFNYEYLDHFRHFLDIRRGDAIMLAEANVSLEKKKQYLGDGHRMQMLFNFYVNQYLFLALARRSPQPLIEALRQQPEIPFPCAMANFVRNHDELSLDKLTEEQRQEVFAHFGPKPDMQIFDRGIRRRLPPMLDGDWRRIKLVYSLLLSLPGTPILRYGEEIGMGDDLSIPGRDSVRTAMQWSDQKSAGFSSVAKKDLQRPLIDKGPFGYRKINVEAQEQDNDSLLNWIEHAIRVRKHCPEFGWGKCEFIETRHPAVMAHVMEWKQGRVMAVHNFSDKKCQVTLPLPDKGLRHLTDLLGERNQEKVNGGVYRLGLKPYGCRWFRLHDIAHTGMEAHE